MSNFTKIAVAICMMLITFPVVFLAIFVPMLMHDMHVAPHDGQGGMSGAFLGLPVALIAAIAMGPISYVWLTKRNESKG
jgi:hypothetical protein